ncbi:iron-containing alcohol dehydrogenase [Terribacillus saccharophilus]|uniref:iron-containing alcohol dehydrogenase n=1 Tax=Terribacillus saccharophilus TaxID=361277 RepID=UPI003981C30A
MHPLFSCPTTIMMKNGLSHSITAILADSYPEVKTIMIVSDKGIVQAGLMDEILSSLEEHGYAVHLFTEVKPNPREEDCEEGCRQFRLTNPELVLAIGGGSVIDTAKAIALVGPTTYNINDMVPKIPKEIEPAHLVCMPTTAGTGAEVTRSSVLTLGKSSHLKITLKSEKIRPQLALIDPVLSYSAPVHVKIYAGVDAFVHALESYTNKRSNPVSDVLAVRAMQLAFENLPLIHQDKDAEPAHGKMMEASLLAGMSFASSDVAAIHCLSEALSSLYDTPHGLANSILLLPVMTYNAETSSDVYGNLSRDLGIASPEETDEEATSKLLSKIASFVQQLEIPSLQSLSYVKEKDFKQLSEIAFKNGSNINNAREMTKKDYLTVLEQQLTVTKI